MRNPKVYGIVLLLMFDAGAGFYSYINHDLLLMLGVGAVLGAMALLLYREIEAM